MEYLRQPWAHQAEAIRRATSLASPDPQDQGFALFFEPGAGKTMTAINILRHQMTSRKKFFRTLVFCPPIVIRNWREEFLANSRIPGDRIVGLTGPCKRRLKIFLASPWAEAGGVFITNYEALLDRDLYDAFRNWQPEALIFDESHALKTHNAKRSKLAERLANAGPTIPYKQLLTGTPVLNNPMDLFHQFLVLDGGRTLSGNFFAFRARFFRDRNAGMPKQKYFPNWEIMSHAKDGFDALAELNRLIGPRSMHVTKAECMDLPPLVSQTIKVAMSPEQRRMYEEMKRDFVTMVDIREKDPKAVVATLAITKALRLQQIASGYVKTNEDEEIGLDGTPKMDALRELLEELTPNGKVLVWAAWRNNYGQIEKVCERLALKYVKLVGGMSDSARNAAVDSFTKDPEIRVLIGNPGSGGIGVNLIEAPYAIFFSQTFSLKDRVQAEARNYRGGSEVHEKITHYTIVCENSIDEIVSEKLASKIEMSDKLLGSLASELKKQG